jgi:hypothetical protein
MSASLATLNMVILWTGILAAVLVVILRLMGLLRSVRSIELRINCVKETTRKHEDMCGIYLAHGLTVAHVPVSVSTVWTSRLVINYLKTIGSPYRRQVGFGTVQLLSTPASSIFESRWIMVVIDRSFDERRSC